MSDLEDDDRSELSAHALSALQEFYAEQTAAEQRLLEAQKGNVEDLSLEENWQLSQFWYDESTATHLAQAALMSAGDSGCIACVSSPTVYKKLRELKPSDCSVKCLEFDERFSIYGEDFVYYDYKDPVNFPSEWKNSFDVVIADPPFLSEECLCKTALTIRFLAKDKIILCTGAVMEDLASRLLGLRKCKFQPKHVKQLQNEFRCFSNFENKILDQIAI